MPLVIPLNVFLCAIICFEGFESLYKHDVGALSWLKVGSKGLLLIESHPRFLQFYQKSHKARYLVLYLLSSS